MGFRIGKETMNVAGAPQPQFDVLGNIFKVTVYPIAKHAGEKNGEKNGGVNGGVNDVYGFICRHPGSKSVAISKELNISQRMTERFLKQLKDEGKVAFKGAPKTGGYYPR